MTLRDEFDRVWPWLQAAVEYSREPFTADDVWQRIDDSSAQLWSAEHGALVTMIEIYPAGEKAVRIWLGGGRMDHVTRLSEFVEEWAREKGACKITISGRRGWLRALNGYREATVNMTKDLS